MYFIPYQSVGLLMNQAETKDLLSTKEALSPQEHSVGIRSFSFDSDYGYLGMRYLFLLLFLNHPVFLQSVFRSFYSLKQ